MLSPYTELHGVNRYAFCLPASLCGIGIASCAITFGEFEPSPSLRAPPQLRYWPAYQVPIPLRLPAMSKFPHEHHCLWRHYHVAGCVNRAQND